MPRSMLLMACLFVSLPSMHRTLAQDRARLPTTRGASFADRLADARFIGLSVDEKLGGFTLHLYTAEQQESNLASLAAYRIEMKEYQSKLASFDTQRQAALQRRATGDELNSITNARNAFTVHQPSSPFYGGNSSLGLYDVVLVGPDYLEIQASENPTSTTLIPFVKICRVYTPKKSTENISPE